MQRAIDVTRRCILKLNEECYGGIKVNDEQARERAISVVGSLAVMLTDCQAFQDMFDQRSWPVSTQITNNCITLYPAGSACGFKFDEFGSFIAISPL